MTHRCPHTIYLLVALASGCASTVRAEVRVEGTVAAIHVITGHDKIADVLSALATTLNVEYRTAIPLDAPADASYSGSLGQVTARLLGGYNYVIKRGPDTIEIVVFGTRGEVAIPPPKPPKPKGIASQWR